MENISSFAPRPARFVSVGNGGRWECGRANCRGKLADVVAAAQVEARDALHPGQRHTRTEPARLILTGKQILKDGRKFYRRDSGGRQLEFIPSPKIPALIACPACQELGKIEAVRG